MVLPRNLHVYVSACNVSYENIFQVQESILKTEAVFRNKHPEYWYFSQTTSKTPRVTDKNLPKDDKIASLYFIQA